MKFFRTNAAEMPFLDHLEELRWRLIWSLGTLVVFAAIGFGLVAKFDVLGLLVAPIQPFLQGSKLKYLSPTEPFFITIKLGVLVGIILGAPVVIYHIWSFLSPALKPGEKKAILPSLYLGVLLFVAGAAMAYYIVLPVTLRFTMGFQTESLQQNIVIGEYLSMVVRLLLAFGIVFEMPVVILALSALGVVTPEFLASKRRHAVLIITVACSIITPGDVVTITLLMMVPLVLLYEMSIFLSKMVTRRRLAASDAAMEG
ncbi:MAG TPA: twin-arginine translocase subunit TatC [Longimicrobiaceae bacterium]|nr:twin-arginine translocase subunit TatC [Longimicrobiaceae bacterium]